MRKHGHDHQVVPSDPALRIKALESLLVEKGLVDPAFDTLMDTFEIRSGRATGRAWWREPGLTPLTSGASRKRYRRNRRAWLFGRAGRGYPGGREYSQVHNLIVCTCAHAILGRCWAATGLVQVLALSFAGGDRSARRVARVWTELPKSRGARLGQHRRRTLSGVARAPAGTKSSKEDELAAWLRGTRWWASPKYAGPPGSRHERHPRYGRHARHGPIEREKNEPVFHARWEARVYALNRATGVWGKWNLDASRHSREVIPPAEYLRMSYYEKWLEGTIGLLLQTGMITQAELESGKPAHGSAKATPPMTPAMVRSRFLEA